MQGTHVEISVTGMLRVVPIPVVWNKMRVGMNSENPIVKRPQMDLGMSPVTFYLHRSCRQIEEERREGCWRVVRGPRRLGLRS